jgi:hypothetical protein
VVGFGRKRKGKLVLKCVLSSIEKRVFFIKFAAINSPLNCSLNSTTSGQLN